MKRFSIIALATSAVLLMLLLSSSMYTTHAAKVLLFSDLHLDPYYGTSLAGRGNCHSTPTATQELGSYGCDSPMDLVDESIAQASKDIDNIDLVLITGDTLRHDAHLLNYSDLQKAVKSITGALSTHLGNHRNTVLAAKPPLLASIGNNDAVPDYFFNISAANKMMLTDIAEQLKEKYFLSHQEASDFGECGFFKRSNIQLGSKNKKLDLIVLNTLLWSSRQTPPPPPGQEADPCGQLQFLRDSLGNATNPVIIISHIPPGIDLFKSTSQLDKGQATIDTIPTFWKDQYSDPFYDIIKQYTSKISSLFFAHTHHAFMIADKSISQATLVVGSISPIYYNAPFWMTIELDDDTLLPLWNTLDQVSLQGELFAKSPKTYWNTTVPTFMQSYSIRPSGIDFANKTTSFGAFADDVHAFADEVCVNETAALLFYDYSAAQGKEAPSKCSAQCRLLASCYMKHLTRKDTVACFKAGCVKNRNNNNDDKNADYKIVGGVLGAMLLVAVIVVAFRQHHASRSAGGPGLNTASPGINDSNAKNQSGFEEKQQLYGSEGNQDQQV